jgi:hypothetical protein
VSRTSGTRCLQTSQANGNEGHQADGNQGVRKDNTRPCLMVVSMCIWQICEACSQQCPKNGVCYTDCAGFLVLLPAGRLLSQHLQPPPQQPIYALCCIFEVKCRWACAHDKISHLHWKHETYTTHLCCSDTSVGFLLYLCLQQAFS